MYQIITLFVLAAVAVAAADVRERRYAGGDQNLNVQSSSAFSGPNGGRGPGRGSAASGGASASASSYAGSSSYSGDGGNSGGSYSGSGSSPSGSYGQGASNAGSPSGSYGQGASNAGSSSGSYGQGASNAGSPSGSYGQGASNAGSPSGSYGQGASNAGSPSGSYGQGSSNAGSPSGSQGPSNPGYGDKGPSDNAIPSGNTPGSANFASSYPGSGSGYAGGYSNSYGGSGGFPDSGFTPGQNLPPGCFSGFQGAGFDPFKFHQEIMNQIQRQHEENLRFGAGLAAQAGQGGIPHTITYVYHTGNAPWTTINPTAAFNQQLANFLRFFQSTVPAAPYSFPRVVPIKESAWYSNPNKHRYASYQSAFASGHIGPGGGFGAAGVSPQDPGSLAVRFGDSIPNGPVHSISGNIPSPSGNTYGISTSSHSVTDTVNGVPKTYKESSVTINDNGKVTSYKSHSP